MENVSETILDDAVRPPKFRGGDAFVRLVRARVAQRLAGRTGRGDQRLCRKAAIVLVWFVLSYACVLAAPNTWIYVAASLSWAVAAAALAFNIFHDANHGAFSSDEWVNVWVSRLACAALGVGRHFWRQKHHPMHHQFVNVLEWDDDLESRGWLRLSPEQPWAPRYRWQYLFFLPLYALNSLEWIAFQDFVKYFTRMTNKYRPIVPMTRGDKLEFWCTKLIYVGLFVIPPFFMQPLGRVIIGFLVFHSVLSVLLTVTQLAHLNDQTVFSVNNEPGVREEDWGSHQMRATVNFAVDNPVATWFLGGLNFQIEHHLFPSISHTHYPEISEVVREVAGEFGLPYRDRASLSAAIGSHHRLLRALAVRPSAAPPSGVAA